MRRNLLFTVLIGSIQMAIGQTGLVWDDPIIVATGSFDNTRPRIALMSDDVPAVIWGKSSTDVVYFSRFDGAVFSAPQQINPSGTDAFVATWAGPEVATSGDTVFVVYVQDPAVSGPVYTRRSIDAGINWEDTVRVDGPNSIITHFPSITTGVGGTPIITFMEHDNGWADPRYVVVNSMDGGLSFLDPVPASGVFAQGEVCDCCPADIIQGNDKQLLMFRNNDNNERDIWATSSSNNGSSFDTGQDIDFATMVLSVCPSSGPTGIISGDSLFFAWMSILGNSNRVNVGSAGLADLLPVTNTLIDPSIPLSGIQNYPRMAGKNDTLAIVWEETISGNSECVVQWSSNGIQSLSDKDTVNLDPAGAQTNPDVAFSNGYFHFVWQNNSSNEVFYRRAQIVALTSIPVDPRVNEGKVLLTRIGDQLSITSRSAIKEVSIYDIQGRSIAVLTGSQDPQLIWWIVESGTFLFHVLLENGQSTTIKWTGIKE